MSDLTSIINQMITTLDTLAFRIKLGTAGILLFMAAMTATVGGCSHV